MLAFVLVGLGLPCVASVGDSMPLCFGAFHTCCGGGWPHSCSKEWCADQGRSCLGGASLLSLALLSQYDLHHAHKGVFRVPWHRLFGIDWWSSVRMGHMTAELLWLY